MPPNAPSFESVSSCLEYSPESGRLFWRDIRKPHLHGHEAGSIDAGGYRVVKLDGKTFKVSRLAWLLYYGEWPSGRVRYIDGDKENNRIENLAIFTKQKNPMNQNLRSDGRGRYKGVTFQESHQSWLAQLTVSGRTLYLGDIKIRPMLLGHTTRRQEKFSETVPIKTSLNVSPIHHAAHRKSEDSQPPRTLIPTVVPAASVTSAGIVAGGGASPACDAAPSPPSSIFKPPSSATAPTTTEVPGPSHGQGQPLRSPRR
ncbi:HNH endonuclease signature motif containing protein [Methylorubrum aminovorans]